MPTDLAQRRLHALLFRVRPAPLAAMLKDILGVRREIVETQAGRFWVDPVSILGRCLIDEGEFERPMMRTLTRFLQPGGTFVDLGANEGFFTVFGARRVGPTGRVLAIEPQSRLIPVLQKNISLNGLTNIATEQSAISDHAGFATFHLSPTTNSGCSGLFGVSRRQGATERVALKTLSQGLSERGLETVDLLKIDIEGGEHEAILGSADLFRTGRIKAIALEFHPEVLAARGLSGDKIHAVLTQAGYDRSFDGGNDVYALR